MNQQAQAAVGAVPPDPMAQQQMPPQAAPQMPPQHAWPQQAPPQQFQQPAAWPPPPMPHHPPTGAMPPPQAWGQPPAQPAMHCYPVPPPCYPPMHACPPPQAYYCYDQPQPQNCYPPQPSCSPDPCSSNTALEDYCRQVMKNSMGEQAGMFDELMGKLGMEDKEFWKGAMIGAAAVLILSNDKVKDTLTSTLANAGDMFKSGAGMVKDAATNSAEIVKDTVKGGAEGFSDSVSRHKASKDDNDSDESEDNG